MDRQNGPCQLAMDRQNGPRELAMDRQNGPGLKTVLKCDFL